MNESFSTFILNICIDGFAAVPKFSFVFNAVIRNEMKGLFIFCTSKDIRAKATNIIRHKCAGCAGVLYQLMKQE